MPPPPMIYQMSLAADARSIADRILAADAVTVISHIDADGITSEAILSQALQRAGIPAQSIFVRQLEPLTMKHVPENDTLKIFIDLGAGQQNLLEERGMPEDKVVIIDHHVAQDVKTPYPQINAITYGYEKLSAAGVGYFVAREMDECNRDLAKLAVVGNVGDMMARENCALIGPAREIVDDGVQFGNIEVVDHNLNFYGISTRPIHTCLSFCDDPYIPGISNDATAARVFLERIGIAMRNSSGKMRVFEELSEEERQTLINALAEQLIAHGRSTERLLAETYLFTDEELRSPLRNAAEYATMLNACGRWTKPAIGSSVCQGDRGQAYRDAEHMLRHHRTIIREMMEYILDTGVTELSHLQYLHVGDKFPDTVVGIGAGMALSKLNWKKPIMILCYLADEPDLVKASMRTNDTMVRQGVDLQAALAESAAKLGGAGGGHKIAAGAYIPRNSEDDFAEIVNTALSRQSP